MKSMLYPTIAALVLAVSGCTRDQVYATGQEMQQDRCRTLLDRIEQQQCLQAADLSFEEYQVRLTEEKENARQPKTPEPA